MSCGLVKASWTSKGYSRTGLSQEESQVRLAGDCNPWVSKMSKMTFHSNAYVLHATFLLQSFMYFDQCSSYAMYWYVFSNLEV
jgi:hypothetical protein